MQKKCLGYYQLKKCTKMNNEIKNTLDFINKAINQEQEEYKCLFAFLKRYEELYQKVGTKQSYHINVIDELHANENAHSRILAKLLQQKSHNRFEILESFIEYLTEQKTASFYNLKIESPIITQETERIDLWIRDKTYSIIIENKIQQLETRNTAKISYYSRIWIKFNKRFIKLVCCYFPFAKCDCPPFTSI